MKKIFLVALVFSAQAKDRESLEAAITDGQLTQLESLLADKKSFTDTEKKKYLELAKNIVVQAKTAASTRYHASDFIRIAGGLAAMCLASFQGVRVGKAFNIYDGSLERDSDNKHKILALTTPLSTFALFGFGTWELIKGIMGNSQQDAYNRARLIEALINQIPVNN